MFVLKLPSNSSNLTRKITIVAITNFFTESSFAFCLGSADDFLAKNSKDPNETFLVIFKQYVAESGYYFLALCLFHICITSMNDICQN